MAITIGSGISIGGGISFGSEAGGGGGGNLGSITVASAPWPDGAPNGTTYGANGLAADYYFPVFGTVTGGTGQLVHYTGFDFGPQDQGWLILVNGSYSGFTVSGGAINGITSGPGLSQSFTIGGVTATISGNDGGGNFSGRYSFFGDPFGLDTKLGQTIDVTWNP